jgi:hypothetical protein
MICGNHDQDNVSDDSDRKEDAIENHSKYHLSDLIGNLIILSLFKLVFIDQENQNEEDLAISSNDKSKQI